MSDSLQMQVRPELRDPALILAFEGWNDAGEAATRAVRYLGESFQMVSLARIDPEEFYGKVVCRVLILRATEGIVSQDDLLLPESVVEGMLREIPNAKRVDIEHANHYAIIFQPSAVRDRAIMEFLEG